MPNDDIIVGRQLGNTPEGDGYVVPIGGSAFLSLEPLAANGTVNTGWIAYTGYVNYMYCISSDVAGAVNGVKIDYSNDGETVIRTGNVTGYANPPLLLRVAVTPITKYFRITYTNGAASQTSFYFELVLTTSSIQGSTASAFQPINRGNLATLVKNIPELNDGSNIYSPIQRVADAMKVYVANQTSATDVSALATSEDIEAATMQLLAALASALNITGTVTVSNPTGATDVSALAKEDDGNLETLANKDFATQTTLAAILAKIISAPSTEAKQDAANTLLTTISGKDYATQTTLAAILSKIIAAPATESKQDSANTSLAAISSKDFATQTTLAAVLSKLNSSIAVTGTFYQATQPVSIASTVVVKADSAANQTNALKTDGSATTQPISAASLPLPTNAATSAKQDTTNTSLASIDAGIPTALGQTTMSASMPVVLASDQSALAVSVSGGATSANQASILAGIGSVSDAAVTNQASSGSVIAILKGILAESVAQASTGTRTTYTLVTNVVQTIAANANRKGAIISSPSGTVYVGVGASTVSTSSFDYKMSTGGTVELTKEAAALAIQLVSGSGNTVTVNELI